MPLILGSTSPRREEILRFFTLPFLKAPSHFNEDLVPFLGDPRLYVETLARKKGEALLPLYPNDPILTADTVVYHNGVIYNKPKDKQEAISFLETLQAQEHSVFTAVCLSQGGTVFVEIEETKILFYPLTKEEILTYLRCVNFLDKAGGYAIQQAGGLLVQRIIGCYYNVMGLPLGALRRVLKLGGIDLWEHFALL